MLLRIPLSLLACTGGADSDVVQGGDSGDLPSAYEFVPDEEETEGFDETLAAEALQAVVDEVRTFSADPVLEAYAGAMEDADENCPIWYEYEGDSYWFANCESSAGAKFEGYAFAYEYEDTDISGDGQLWDGLAAYGSLKIIDADGYTLEIGGVVQELGGENDYGDVWYNQVYGGFTWDHPDAEGSWLAEDQWPSLIQYALYYPDYFDIRAYTGSGAVSGLSSTWHTADLNNVAIISELAGFPCDEEPAGSVAIRNGDGHWFDVVFDVQIDEKSDSYELVGACDGCGTAYSGDEVVGEVCADFSGLLEWGDEPW